MNPPLSQIAPWTRRIIIINVVIAFVAEGFAFGGGANPIREYLPLTIEGVLSGRVWQIVTYMWVHAELVGLMVIHLLFNMVTLYFMGRAVEPRIGSKSYIWLYLLGGIVAVAFFFVEQVLHLGFTGSLENIDRPMVGASGAVCAVLGVFSMLLPNTPVYIMFIPYPIRAIRAVQGVAVVSLALVGIGLISGVSESLQWGWLFSVAHSAHLGGICFGWWVASKMVVPGPGTASRSGVDRMSPLEVREALDPILDKVSSEGIHSLTPREMEILQRARNLFG